MKPPILLLCFLLATGEALGCSPTEDAIVGKFERQIKASIGNQSKSIVDFDYLLPVCKAWPQKPGYTIITIPYAYQANKDSERYFGMLAAIVDDKTGEVRALMDDKRLMLIDAIEPNDIDIDTADYPIKPGTLAFGVRIARQNHSAAIPIREEVINIYALDAAGLKKIINALLKVSSYGESDGTCKYSTSETTSSLTVLNTMTNGYFDIQDMVTEIISGTGKSRISCARRNPIRKTTNYVLKFAGKQYTIPKRLQGEVN